MATQKTIQEMSAELCTWLNHETKTLQERVQLAQKIFDSVATQLQQTKDITHIQAPNAVIEFISENGDLYRRYLELIIEENQNGLRIIGENLDGSASQLVYLSQFAIEKMNDLKGIGQNEPSCNSH